ncbi:hypothetical protein [Pseudoalteromonas carrageenovora]|uniref:hypothetical protein n=1 Tax=Pseudoalteromonas carrageenovora TaxID=227 RepID=UPI0026E24B53|nr:hypothetical protein [Pseudoalteromonas carrageenovora]MDO6466402.1 hypothetical protein [Pseudoalteromonas carrageenovora]|tara:strand:- start:42 stop:476 length:435 start_codon:yes stop_codon:yes gene_type:complete
MSSFLTLKVLPEVDDCLKLRVRGSSCGFSGQADCYVNESEFLTFSKSLQGFPKKMDQVLTFDSGKSDSISNFELSFSCANSSGHVKLEVEITHIESFVNLKTNRCSSTFSLVVMPSDIDTFQSNLISVANSSNVDQMAELRSET